MPILITFAVLFIVIFIFWQFKMWKKYNFSYDKFKINVKEEYISVNGKEINLKDIDYVTVKELPQPSAYEKALSKSAYYAYMAQIVFHMKQGPDVPCTFNYKGPLYKTLKQLELFVKIDDDIEYYKPQIPWFNIIIILTAIMIIVFNIVRNLLR